MRRTPRNRVGSFQIYTHRSADSIMASNTDDKTMITSKDRNIERYIYILDEVLRKRRQMDQFLRNKERVAHLDSGAGKGVAIETLLSHKEKIVQSNIDKVSAKKVKEEILSLYENSRKTWDKYTDPPWKGFATSLNELFQTDFSKYFEEAYTHNIFYS